ncbi:MAG TPA: hypothetical protein VH299_03305 [Solirubrobacterales bacterium]|jgi:hypothetical protein|nr:hypothetical protein [Solirubrobacterales bacterium]
MPEPICPFCKAEVAPPDGHPESLEGNVDCPGCGRPLTWFFDEKTGGKWTHDEEAEGRRRMEEGPGDVDSPVAT